MLSRYFRRETKKNPFGFFRTDFFFFFFFKPKILPLHFNMHRDLFFNNLCSSLVCLLKLSLSSFYATECKTKEYVHILATPGRDRAAAKDPAEIRKKKKKKREKPSRMKHKKNHHPFLCLVTNSTFFCSQFCSATPPYHIQPFAFSLLP